MIALGARLVRLGVARQSLPLRLLGWICLRCGVLALRVQAGYQGRQPLR